MSTFNDAFVNAVLRTRWLQLKPVGTDPRKGDKVRSAKRAGTVLSCDGLCVTISCDGAPIVESVSAFRAGGAWWVEA